jgi:ferredoxin
VASETETALKQEVERLISDGSVGLVVGYGSAFRGEGVRPVFVRAVPDADRLLWNDRCYQNLATYLLREPCLGIIRDGGRVGIVAKGCDVRAIVELVQEAQLPRESAHIIGVVCNGMAVGGGRAGVAVKCRSCKWQVPAVYDRLVGDPSTVEPIDGDPLEDIEIIRSKPRSERWTFWTEHLAKCIKCYACRQACPLCYCRECITERTRPQWIDKAPSLQGNLAYHFVRATHLAGRCISCGECSRACPMDIPVDMLTRYLSHEVEEAFGYEAGVDPDAEPFFVRHADSDPDDFIR